MSCVHPHPKSVRHLVTHRVEHPTSARARVGGKPGWCPPARVIGRQHIQGMGVEVGSTRRRFSLGAE